jgi:signal transduction histidine kinase
MGVPADELGQIFDAFRRGSNAVDVPGTGLGLFIARRLADLHGGRIAIEAREPGTAVTLHLPIARRGSAEVS